MQLSVNIEKRYAYIIISLLVFVLGAILVTAYNPGNNPAANPSVLGHTSNEINFSDIMAMGKIATSGLELACPSGWVCGVHTWDVYADASARVKNLYITSGADTPNYAGDDMGDSNQLGQLCLNGDCRTSWPTGNGGSGEYLSGMHCGIHTEGVEASTTVLCMGKNPKTECPAGFTRAGGDFTSPGNRLIFTCVKN